VGGNGAGKSTYYEQFLEPLGLPFVNADILAKHAYPDDPEARSLDASKLAEKMREDLLLTGQSFVFETVYSHPSKIDYIAKAKALGYCVIMIMVHLETVEQNKSRVALRVAEGGHSVPDDKIISRIPRMLEHVKGSVSLCDNVQAYDNSSRDNPFQLMFSIRSGTVETVADPLPSWAAHILTD